MQENELQKTPQKARKFTVNNFYGGLHIHNTIKKADEQTGYEETFLLFDTIAIAIFLAVLFSLGYFVFIAALGVGRLLFDFYTWILENWKILLVGFSAILFFVGVIFWYFVTHTKDEQDDKFV